MGLFLLEMELQYRRSEMKATTHRTILSLNFGIASLLGEKAKNLKFFIFLIR